ncbi:hypothetical protein BO79DRAFT_173240 [Aspergillus costaricaensis CBS 115574]|uniref:Uncharacterized protein n=1 Tax=Aspergillus costaricaensis CBS 115574 TaxID=1448317 RepID=A0ACD1IEG4_9EURO|nr:hypothetical protein BO79DRAFT_173240 [Aspergillus costaricaensis CBS 115574]RAK88471.1 hypothetical protein BO79DRAFT_173240 [Aspergillus costaricaensis CBS 115574]
MNPSSSAIVTAFNEKLPTEVAYAYSEPYRFIRSTASSTIESDPVAVYFEEEIDTYHKLFDRYFPRIGAGSPLNARMPVLEQTHLLEAEADVLRLATLQLIHPVNIALQQTCPRGTRIICRTESTTSSTSRLDVEWSLYNTQGALLSRLAILEIKNTNVIHRDDFQRAAVNEQNFQAKTARAMDTESLTLLQRNAVWLSKQAHKYSEHCPYVAIFDYSAMFLFSFLWQTTKPVRGFYFDESGRTSGMTFRRLLFAFVVRALKGYEARMPQKP